MSILGICLSLFFLIYLSYRGHSVLLVAPAAATLAVVMSGGPPMGTYTQIFMTGLGGFVVLFFPIFLFGALFGKLMAASGSADAIAHSASRLLGPRNAILSVILACAILTYGGVSLFVVAFAVYPIAASLFRANAIPKRLIPGAIALGAFTFTMTALPGTPAIQNAIPMPYFGTTLFAAPGLGVIAGVLMLSLGCYWLYRRANVAITAGESFDASEVEATEAPVVREREERTSSRPSDHTDPSPLIGILPILIVLIGNYVIVTFIIPRMPTDYLASPSFGATTIASLAGIWSIVASLALACCVLVLLNRRRIASLTVTLSDGASSAVLPIINTASLVGFGTVIATLPGFTEIRDTILGAYPQNPLVSLAIAVNALAGITGSASGGMSIALKTLGDAYLAMGNAAGISPELLHRVTSISTGGLDALPHNGAVVTLLSICGLTHKQAYLDIFVVAVLSPLFALAVVIILGSVLGNF